jgi:hypothetical protein
MSPSTPSGSPRPRTPGGGSRPASGGRSGGSGRPAGKGTGSGKGSGASGGRPSGKGAGSGSGRPSGSGSGKPSGSGYSRPSTSGSGASRPPKRDSAPGGYQGSRTGSSSGSRTGSPSGSRTGSSSGSRPTGRPPARRGATDAPDHGDDRANRSQISRRGWGSVTRRGASIVRDGIDHGPDEDTPEGRRRSKKRTDEFVPEEFVRVDDRSGATSDRLRPPAHRPVREPDELPADIAQELATAAGPDWNFLRTRITERMTAGIGAYQRERYRDAARILRTVVEAVPNAASAVELLGLSQYHQGNWKAALPSLEMFATLTGSVDQHPVRMDCHRALGRPKRVEALFNELRAGSPDAEVLSEGRLVLAGTRADLGDLDGAVRLLVDAGAGRLVRNPSERHLRQWYVLADLTERSGDMAKARELFLRVQAADPDAYDVADRLEALGPPTRPRRTPNKGRGAH